MATIRDVARRAGVAPSTVSYVLNGDRSTTEETRSRVREAVEVLGYHPRAGARMLRSGRTRVLALALPRSAGTMPSVDGRFAVEISDAAAALGYDLLMSTSQDKAEGLRRVAVSGLADAAVVMAVDLEDARIDVVRELAFPAALIGRPADEGALPWTDLDWERAAVLAVRAVAAAGHRNFAYLAPTRAEVVARRSSALHGIAGARKGARDTGAVMTLVYATDEPAETEKRLHTLLGRPVAPGRRPPTALIVQHPTAHHHVLPALAAAGVRVPEDVTVVVIGSLPGDPSGLRLPRVELPVGAMAAEAVRLAVAAAQARPSRAAADVTALQAPHSPEPSGHLLIAPVLLSGDGICAAPPA